MSSNMDDAVSPVIGVMLMLVVTIIIAAFVSAFAGNAFGNTETTPSAALLMISHPWGDLGYKEVHPVMKSKEALRQLKG